jgi:hypothetical protein
MSHLTLQTIVALGEDRYEVTFRDSAGATEVIVCKVFVHKGVPAVGMTPDLVMSSQPPRIDSRAVAREVLNYHRRRRLETDA